MVKARSEDGRRLRPLGGAWHSVCLHQGLVSKGRCHKIGMMIGGYLIVWHRLEMGSKAESWFCGRRTCGLCWKLVMGFFFYGSVVAHEMMDVTAGVCNLINLFTHASNSELLAKHEKVVKKSNIRSKQRSVL